VVESVAVVRSHHGHGWIKEERKKGRASEAKLHTRCPLKKINLICVKGRGALNAQRHRQSGSVTVKFPAESPE
jgi:hypothetical protein